MVNRLMYRWLVVPCTVFLIGGLMACPSARAAELGPPTHKQIRTIEPELDGQRVRLMTICSDGNGNILACCGGVLAKRGGIRSTIGAAKQTTDGQILVYSPEGKLVKNITLDFVPTAINVAPDGAWFVGGSGQLRKLDANGVVQLKMQLPHLKDKEKLRAELTQAAKEQAKRLIESYKKRLEQVETRIGAIEKTPVADRTTTQSSMLKTLTRQRDFYKKQAAQMKNTAARMYNVDAMVARMGRITGIAVGEKDVFVACATTKGYGYDIWRFDHQLQNPVLVVPKQGGCCGQFDIQCDGKNLLIAENTKFQVGTYDRDGKRLSGFGKRDRTSAVGFGSCCNPMNVRACANGDILTAESSIGHIKRFRPDGQLVAYIGQAKVSGGCKHCALGIDEKRDRIYMMRQDANCISVLVPKAEAPEFTEDELAAKQARQGLGKKVVGKWRLAKDDSKQVAKSNNPLFGRSSGSRAAKSFEFAKDGTFVQTGGLFATSSIAASQWRAVSQDGNQLEVVVVASQMDRQKLRIDFTSDDTATISILYGQQTYATDKYKRAE